MNFVKNIYFIESEYVEAEGISYVTMYCEGRYYEETAYLHPDDVDFGSRFAGCRIAETRCIIKILKNKLSKAREKYKIIEDFVKSLQCCKSFNKEESSYKTVFKQLNYRAKYIAELKKYIVALDKSLDNSISRRSEIVSKLKVVK